MNPFRPADLTAEDMAMLPPSRRPLSVVLLAMASIALGIVVFAAPFSNGIQTFFRPRFGTELPFLLALPGLCMALWLCKPTIRLLVLAALLFLLLGSIYYFRTSAHMTLWGSVDTVLNPAGGRLSSSLLWCAAPFFVCGVFLLSMAGRLKHLTTKWAVSKKQRIRQSEWPEE
ncbi:hypothetical protein FYK55_27130 [Roseiconus nitratireducens]|uniref:Uncharacterized protein n=1 Tax=Roseiconus nitratireducens TaxID=2605748 RepID=A0A5M6CTM1_9BACT|nr:hypothetical protein [Roseiconus nitratireducens]KAA5538658.1 hypothetical protein FYK55_27130 [Roseiconus nitratireducens]